MSDCLFGISPVNYLDPDPVTETMKANQYLSSGKALRSDAIPAEINKAGGQPMAENLTELFHCMWRKEVITKTWAKPRFLDRGLKFAIKWGQFEQAYPTFLIIPMKMKPEAHGPQSLI